MSVHTCHPFSQYEDLCFAKAYGRRAGGTSQAESTVLEEVSSEEASAKPGCVTATGRPRASLERQE